MSSSLRQNISFPLPTLKPTLDASAPREDKLKEIISNISNQQNQVRNNILAAAKARLADDESTPTQISTEDQAATELLIANLSAPYVEGSGDPCVKSRADWPKVPPGIRQVTPPPQIRLAKEALHQIDEYDQHANKARDHYIRALERRRSSAGFNTYPSSVVATGKPSANASPIDAARDPRRRPR